MTRRLTDYRPPSLEQQREESRRLVPPGSELRAPDREHDYQFVLVTSDGAEARVVWSLKVQEFDDWPSEFKCIAAGTAEPGVLVLVYREGSWVHVHAVDVRQSPDGSLQLPTRTAEALRLGGIAAIRVDRAEVRGNASDGSLTVVLSGPYMAGKRDAFGVIARTALRKYDWGLRWSSTIEAIGISEVARKTANPAEIRRAEMDKDWDASDEVPLAEGGVLEVRRRKRFDPDPRAVKHQYGFWLTARDGARDDVPWFPVVADSRESAGTIKVLHAARVDGGYLALVVRHGGEVRVRVVDLRAGGREARPDLGGREEAELLRLSDGTDVRSARTEGSVAAGTFTVRLRGTSPGLGKGAEGEIARATLVKEGGTYRWTVGTK